MITWPGTALVVLGTWVIVRPGITTLATGVHTGSVLPAGQLLPGAVVTAVSEMTWLPAG